MTRSSSATEVRAAIAIRDVHKAYRRGETLTPVLRGIDLAVQSGECVILAGPSGSGKTTLLSICGGLLSADRGSVHLLGKDVSALDARQRADLRLHHIGFVFQRFHLIRGLSAVENVRVPLTLAGRSATEADERAAYLLAMLGLAEKTRRDTRQLSVGECQRVALARALALSPALILADEPTASLDGESGARAMQLLRDLASAERATIVVVTHDPRIFPLADRICHLERGRIATMHEPSPISQ
jgi:putative ABC transport system ATP-binding protein